MANTPTGTVRPPNKSGVTGQASKQAGSLRQSGRKEGGACCCCYTTAALAPTAAAAPAGDDAMRCEVTVVVEAALELPAGRQSSKSSGSGGICLL